SIVFNAIILVMWYTDFGTSPAFQGSKASRELEDAQARMRQTGTFVAALDNQILENMNPEQLDMLADRAWRRKRRLEKDVVEDDEMQRRDVLLRVRTYDPEQARLAVEG